MKLSLTVYLSAALALSLIGNALLGWQWVEAAAECDGRIVAAELGAVNAERARATKAGKEATRIAIAERTDTARAIVGVIKGMQGRDQDFSNVPTTGDCVMPDSPSLQPAVDAANAAAGL